MIEWQKQRACIQINHMIIENNECRNKTNGNQCFFEVMPSHDLAYMSFVYATRDYRAKLVICVLFFLLVSMECAGHRLSMSHFKSFIKFQQNSFCLITFEQYIIKCSSFLSVSGKPTPIIHRVQCVSFFATANSRNDIREMNPAGAIATDLN